MNHKVSDRAPWLSAALCEEETRKLLKSILGRRSISLKVALPSGSFPSCHLSQWLTGSLTLSKKSDKVYSLIRNFRITKPGITWETPGESHRNVSCAARVCRAGKGCRRKLELHLLPLFKLLLALLLKHWHPQLRLANSPLCNDRWHINFMYRFSLVFCFDFRFQMNCFCCAFA